MLILKDEHAIDVLKSGNTGHLWHDFHAIGVHTTDVGHPDGDDDDDEDDEDDEESPGEVCQEAGDHLEREEDEDGHPVEEVGHDGGGEAKPVLVALLDVVESDHCGGEAGANVCAHHHWDPLL